MKTSSPLSLFESPIRRDGNSLSKSSSNISSKNEKLLIINPLDYKSKDYFISRYSFVEKFIHSIHNERIWKTIKLNEAIFNLSMAKESHPECFHPMISLIEIEVDLILFIISGSKYRIESAKEKCNENFHIIQKVLHDIEMINEAIKSNLTEDINYNSFDCDEFHIFSIECHFIEAEIQLINSALGIYQKNYLSGGQLLLKSINKIFKISSLIEDLKKALLKKKVIEIISIDTLKENRNLSINRVPKDDDVIKDLENLIDAKTKDIRSQNIDRRGIIPEHIIEATRDLLQYKELYKELKGSWKSSDGHSDIIIDENLYNNVILKQMNNLSVIDENKIIVNENDISINLNKNLEYSDENKENMNENIKSNKKISKKMNNSKKNNNYCSPIKKPLKKNNIHSFAVPIVHVMIPGLPNLYNYFLNNSSSQKFESPKKRTTSLYRNDYSPIKVNNTSPIKDKCKNNNQNNLETSTKSNLFNTIEDFSKYNTTTSNSIQKYLINLESRLSFAFGIFNLLGCFVPGELSWILKLISLTPSIGIGFGKLFQVHLYKDCIWYQRMTISFILLYFIFRTNLASIILLNIPNRVITKGFNDFRFVNSLSQNVSVTANTFTSLIEAQLIVRMPKNYLFLYSVANYKHSHNNGVTTKLNLSQRINYLTRAITDINNDNINDQIIVPFFALINLIKYYFFGTDWNNSLECCIRLQTLCLNRSLYKSMFMPQLYKICNLLIMKSFKTSSYSYNHHILKYEKISENLTKNKENQDNHLKESSIYQLLNDLIIEHENETGNQDVSLLNKLRTYQLWGSIYLKSEENTKKSVEDFLWLLPFELIYMIDSDCKTIIASEANHSNWLMQLDRAALCFADTIIKATKDSNDPYRLLADLIKAIVLDNLSNRDKALLRDVVSPLNAIEIYYEKSLFGTPTIRLRIRTVKDENHSLFSDLKDRVASMDTNLSDIVSLVTTRYNSIKNGKLFSSISKMQITGDIVLRWLNIRGIILSNMSKAYEASLMFKIMEALQSFAIIDKISSISANYHIADLVLDYTIINEPIKIASLYLDKSSRLLQAKNPKKSAYYEDYFIKIKDLIRRF